ncbi:MAG: hypothetical protein ACOZCL_08910 [Bacillota bacterium]
MDDNTVLLPTYIESFSEKVVRESINKRLHSSDEDDKYAEAEVQSRQDAEMITEANDERL